MLNAPGNFTVSKLKWVMENEPELYKKVKYFMLPGDYIAYKLTGEISTTINGLSEAILWDFKSNSSADWLLDYFGIDKNFIPFVDGKSLLEVKLEMLKKITLIDEIIVNTDSQRAMDIADKYGVSKKRRVTYYASNECTNSEFFENMAKTTDTDYLIYSPCTAPLVKESTYYDFINRFINGIDNVGLIRMLLINAVSRMYPSES